MVEPADISRLVMWTAFDLLGSPVTWLEVLAFGLSLWMVRCNMRVQPLAWPLAIAASVLYGVLFAHSRLYGEAALQVVFIMVSAWGWQQWLRGRDATGAPLAVRRLGGRGGWWIGLAVLAAWPTLGLLLDHATDSDVPYADALPTVASVAGQWLLARKYLENWPVWLVVNILSVGLFAWKGLWLTVVLYAIFALLSWWGWQAWRRMLPGAAPAQA
ncbi:MAG: nicotinamide riboside transporter PnuC [Aquabacterium sp.]